MPASMTPGNEFHMLVGKCITAWARVEEHLFKICATSLGTTDQRAAIVYFRTPTIESRLQLTDELLRTVLPKPERKSGGHDHADVQTWDRIRKDIGKILQTRNRIAHHPVADRKLFPTAPEGAVGMLFDMSWFESVVSDAERLRGRHDDAKPLLAPHLSAHRLDVEMIITKLAIFREQVLSKHVG